MIDFRRKSASRKKRKWLHQIERVSVYVVCLQDLWKVCDRLIWELVRLWYYTIQSPPGGDTLLIVQIMRSGPQVWTSENKMSILHTKIRNTWQETSKDGNPTSGDRVFPPCKMPRRGKKASSFYPRHPLGVVLWPTWREMLWLKVKLMRGESRTFWEGGQEVEGQTAGSRGWGGVLQ